MEKKRQKRFPKSDQFESLLFAKVSHMQLVGSILTLEIFVPYRNLSGL
jgi:hypothetical protein